MTGLKFDFDVGDIVIDTDGSFVKANIDSQCAALIALSQICRLTVPLKFLNLDKTSITEIHVKTLFQP